MSVVLNGSLPSLVASLNSFSGKSPMTTPFHNKNKSEGRRFDDDLWNPLFLCFIYSLSSTAYLVLVIIIHIIAATPLKRCKRWTLLAF